MTILHDAVRERNIPRIIEILESKKIDVNALDEGGNTAIFIVCTLYLNFMFSEDAKNEHYDKYEKLETEITQILLKNGADVNIGKSGLALVASHGSLKRMNLILDAGADLEGKDDYGYTALQNIMSVNFRENLTDNDIGKVKELIKRGADVNAINNDQELSVLSNALSVFHHHNDHRILAILILNAGAEIDEYSLDEPAIKGAVIQEILKADKIMDEEVIASDITLSDETIDLCLPRLRSLMKIHGVIPLERLEELSISTIKKEDIKKEIESIKEEIAVKIEISLAELLMKVMPKDFASPTPYSLVLKYQDYGSQESQTILKKMFDSYQKHSEYQPYNFYKSILDPNNIDETLKVFTKYYKDADQILKSLECGFKNLSHMENFKDLKDRYNAISLAVKTNLTEQEENVTKLNAKINQLEKTTTELNAKVTQQEKAMNSQAESIKSLTDRLDILEKPQGTKRELEETDYSHESAYKRSKLSGQGNQIG